VRRDAAAHRYELDDTAFALGLPALSPLISACRVALERIAAETGECCTLVLRSGLDSISVDRVLGRHPLRGLTLVGGDRRPLGTSGGSVAILAHLPDDQLDDINLRNAARLAAYGLDRVAVREAVAKCRARGYALAPSRAVPGLGVLGAAIPRRAGGAVAALALIGPIHRFSGRDAARAATILQVEAGRLAALPALHGGLTAVARRHQGEGVSTRRKGQRSPP
jgi:DNA-binding IclR family transcriptional regulator